MRKILTIAAAAALISSHAEAQTVSTGFYGELGVGLSLLQNVKTEPFSIPVPNGTLTGTVDTEFSSPQGMFGAELGFATPRWRFGVSYDWMDAPLDGGTLDGKVTQPLHISLTKQDLETLGFETDSAFMITA